MDAIPMKQRDIILIPFPFSDQQGRKVRPALIISNDIFNRSDDMIICALTANTSPTQHKITIRQGNLADGKLHKETAIKVETIAKLKKSLAIKKIASINDATHNAVQEKLAELFSRSI